MDNLWIILLISSLAVFQCEAQIDKYFICATSRFFDQCTQLQRGASMVNCVLVQDSIECAQRIRNGTAHFGVFSSESTLLLASLGWDGMSVVKELRHTERNLQTYDFASVVIVRSTHQNGVSGLQGSKFCHPGYFYDRSQKWSERFLKHFERTVAPTSCDGAEVTPAEIETAAFGAFFGPSCRPGTWSNNLQEDRDLKLRYPDQCALCNPEPGNCTYNNPDSLAMSHQVKAIHCLVNGGDVAYTSLEDAQQYFLVDNPTIANDYSFLCPNGSIQPINTPCTWMEQPWRTIIVANLFSINLKTLITGWIFEGVSPTNWQSHLREIVLMDNYALMDTTIQVPLDYFRPFRDVPTALPLCSTTSTWCTTSYEEKDKCEVIRVAGITTGVYPQIDCREPTTSTVACLNDISANRADFMAIDSNFGFLARYPHNLTAAMYAETEYGKYSSIVVLIRVNSTITRFENLKNTKACFPEYAGIASIAFVNLGKNRGFLANDECNFGKLLGDFFDSSCLPGARDSLHQFNDTNPENLCTLCRPAANQPGVVMNFVEESSGDEPPAEVDDLLITRNSEINCAADSKNRFYGNAGALQCLSEQGDVAVVELQYLREHAINSQLNEHDFRIICRNGSLAENTGFDVDEDCALTTIVDGEVVVRRGSTKAAGIISALNSFDTYFQSDPDFKMFNIFSNNTNLLFKDSTLGLVSEENSFGKYVSNYITLFGNLDRCMARTNSAISLKFSIMALIPMFITIISRYI